MRLNGDRMRPNNSLPRKVRGIFESGPGIQRLRLVRIWILDSGRGCGGAVPGRSPLETCGMYHTAKSAARFAQLAAAMCVKPFRS
jgi:hypothetical protein